MPEREEPAEEAANLTDALRQSLGRRPTARRQRDAERSARAEAAGGPQGGVIPS